MFKLRDEVTSYMRACEHLISDVQCNSKLSVDEREVVDYYAGELSRLTKTEPDGDTNLQTQLWPDDNPASTHLTS
jgi:hypothetical protein